MRTLLALSWLFVTGDALHVPHAGLPRAIAKTSRSPLSSMSASESSLPAQCWGAYERQLAAQPVATKALTSLVGFAIGDVIAQTLVEQAEVIE